MNQKRTGTRTAPGKGDGWTNPLIKRAVLDSPVVEANPVLWHGRLLVVERWETRWDDPPEDPLRSCTRIREEETDRILFTGLWGYGLPSAFVWNDRLYLFAASNMNEGENTIDVCWSDDLVNWSEPQTAIPQDEDGTLYNQSVCHDGSRFVMAYETRAGVPFTSKFAVSDDLLNWTRVEGAEHGRDRYAACPAIRFNTGWYYMLYLARPTEEWWFETWLTRSHDLIHWEEAPRNPVIVPDPELGVYPGCPDHAEQRGCTAGGREINASDPDLVEICGRVRVYFTGGCQHVCGRLQYAEFDGSMQDFFESYYS